MSEEIRKEDVEEKNDPTTSRADVEVASSESSVEEKHNSYKKTFQIDFEKLREAFAKDKTPLHGVKYSKGLKIQEDFQHDGTKTEVKARDFKLESVNVPEDSNASIFGAALKSKERISDIISIANTTSFASSTSLQERVELKSFFDLPIVPKTPEVANPNEEVNERLERIMSSVQMSPKTEVDQSLNIFNQKESDTDVEDKIDDYLVSEESRKAVSHAMKRRDVSEQFLSSDFRFGSLSDSANADSSKRNARLTKIKSRGSKQKYGRLDTTSKATLQFGISGWIRNLFLASSDNIIALHKLKSTEAINRERERHLELYPCWVIHPFSPFMYHWSFIVVSMTYLTLYLEPLLLTFEYTISRNYPDLRTVSYVVYVFYTLIYFDVGLHFITGFYNKETKLVELNIKPIVVNYLKSDFPIHAIFSVPWYFLAEWKDNFSDTKTVDQIRRRDWFTLGCCASLLRVGEIHEYIDQFEKIAIHQKTLYQILKMFINISLLFNYCACFELNVYSWSQGINSNRPFYNNMSWIIRENFTIKYRGSLAGQYAKCMYRACSNLLFYGDAIMVNLSVEDRTLASFLRLVGVVLYLYVLSHMLIIVRSKYITERKTEKVEQNFKELIRHKRLPTNKIERITDFMEFKFDHTFFKEVKIFNSLSTHLQKDIQIFCSRSLVEKVPFFKDLPNEVVSSIVKCLKTDFYLPGDTIVKAGRPGDSMYFLIYGTVALYTKDGAEITHLQDGAYFGEVALISETALRMATVQSISPSELQYLSREDFRRIIDPYPELFQKIQKNAAKRVEATTDLERFSRNQNSSSSV